MADDASEADDRHVIETRDVTDLGSEEEVNEEVNDMLDPSDLAETELRPEMQALVDEAKRRQDATDSTEVRVASDEPEDLEKFDFEAQDWTLDTRKSEEVRDFRGMKFLFREPEDDDEVLDVLEEASEAGRSEQMKAIVQMVVHRPKIDDGKWASMSAFSKLGLAGQAADYLDLGEDFLEE